MSIFNKEYRVQLSELRKKHFANDNLKIDNRIEFLEEKKRLMVQQRMAAKKSFSKTISSKAKLISRRKENNLREKLKNNQKIDKSDEMFLKNESKRRKKLYFNYGYKTFLYSILIFYLVITLYPFIWSILGSFKKDSEIIEGSFNPFPHKWTLENYRELFGMGDGMINSWIMNSFIVATCGTLGNLILNTFAGYALARIKMPGRNKILWTLIALMMVPGQVGLIPNYILLKHMGMTNHLSALIIPALVSISFIFMSRQFFINFPKEVEEASRVDGQNRIAFIFKSVMPLMKPMLMTQAVFSFMGFWNNFMIAKMYIDTPENYTLTVGIQALLEKDAHHISYGQILAGSSISIFPILILYTILNSAFMSSNRTDGDK